MDQVLLAPTCHATKAATAIILHTPVFKPYAAYPKVWPT